MSPEKFTSRIDHGLETLERLCEKIAALPEVQRREWIADLQDLRAIMESLREPALMEEDSLQNQKELTERLRMEQDLAESERRYRELIQYAPTAIYEIDFRTGRFTSVNDSMVDLSGYSREELLRMTAIDLLDVESQARFKERVRKWLVGEKPEEGVEYRVKAKDGRTIYAVLNAKFTRDEYGRPLGAMVVGHDVTARKHMEQALETSERKYRELVQHAATAIYEVDFRTQKFTVVNDAMVEISGYSREELLQMGPADLLDEQDKEILRGRTRQWAAGEKPGESAEFNIRTKDGRILNMVLNSTFTWDDHDQPLKVMVIGHDITERKRVEKMIKSAAARDAFRVRLADALRSLVDPLEILGESSRLLGEYLGADRVYYLELEEDGEHLRVDCDYHNDRMSSTVGRYAISSFGSQHKRAMVVLRTVVVADVAAGSVTADPAVDEVKFMDEQRATNAAYNMRAYVAVPLVSEGRAVGYLCVNQADPRFWPAEEVALIEEAAERTWGAVERARAEAALKQGEQLFRTSIENLNEGFAIFSAVREGGAAASGKIVDFRFDYVNDLVCKISRRPRDQILGRGLLEIRPEIDVNDLFDRLVQVAETGQPLSEEAVVSRNKKDERAPEHGVFDFRASKFGDGLIVTANDVTEQARMEAEHQQAVQEREIHHRLAEQRELERQSYARDIHDGPIQTLSSLAFNLQYIKEVYPDPALKVELDQVSLNIKNAVQELREVINELRPPSVIRFGLAKAIQVHAENMRERYPQIQWKLKLAKDDLTFPEQTCLAMFRIYQEAVNNIIRHSGATRAWITYRVFKDQAKLEIRDNGRGFEAEQDMVQLTSQQHFGLAGIKERVEAIGGTLEIETKPGNGTKIEVGVRRV